MADRITKVWSTAIDAQIPTINEKITQSDINLVATSINEFGNWIDAYVAPTVHITSVNGEVGVVTLLSSHLGLGNVDNTSDISKPISTSVQSALNTKLASTELTTHIGTTNPHSITYTQIGADAAGTAATVQSNLDIHIIAYGLAIVDLQSQIDGFHP